MTLAFELPPCTDSPLSRRDPRWKLACLGPAALAASFPRTWCVALLALVGSLFLALVAQLPLRWYLRRVGIVLSFLAFFVLPLPFLLRGHGLSVGWGPFYVSLYGAQVGALLVVKTLTVLTLLLVLLATAAARCHAESRARLACAGFVSAIDAAQLSLPVRAGRGIGPLAYRLASARLSQPCQRPLLSHHWPCRRHPAGSWP